MKIKILHLYYDIMNLYGEYGNICLLKKRLEDKGYETDVVKKTVTDNDIDFENFDFIYCGAGTESNRSFCLNHLKGFSESFKSAFENNKVILFTGNSWEMLGKSIQTSEGNTLEGLNVFSFTVKEQGFRRLTGDIKAESELLSETVIGFINKCSSTENISSPLFRLTMKPESFDFETEGIHEKNLFGTQIIGPVLVKNPELCEYMAKLIINNKNK